MTKRLIQIDDDLLDRARNTLGTKGITDTVVRALERVIADESSEEREARIHRLGVLEGARVSLGTQGIRDTVVAALKRTVSEESIDERQAGIAKLSADFIEATRDLRDPEIMRGAWR